MSKEAKKKAAQKAKSEKEEKKDPLLGDEEEELLDEESTGKVAGVNSESEEDSSAEDEDESEEEDEDEEAPKKASSKSKAPRVDAAKELRTDAELTRATLEKEPKVMFIIPPSPDDRAGAVHDCYINGYHYPVKKGVMTEVPRSIALLLANHYKITQEAGMAFRLDRVQDEEKKKALDI